jgi:hypothetical protein
MWLVFRWLDGEEMGGGCLRNGLQVEGMLMGFGGGCCLLGVVMLESNGGSMYHFDPFTSGVDGGEDCSSGSSHRVN